MMDHPLTLEETFELLGIPQSSGPWSKNGEPDWRLMRVDMREWEDGCPELVIYVPFEIEGLD